MQRLRIFNRMETNNVWNAWRSKYSPAIAKLTSAHTVALLLLLPNLIWAAMDKGTWWGDPVGYALNSIVLYKKILIDFQLWKGALFNGYKAPLMFWTGQFFLPLGNFMGSISFGLLLIPLISTFITLLLSFRSFQLLFKNKMIALCGCLAIAASPLLNGLSTGFWIEPMQVAVISWFIYIMIKVKTWDFYFALSQFVIAASLAMLIKFSSPLYIIGPSIAFWITVFRNNPSMDMNKKNKFFLFISLLFFIPTTIFYIHNFNNLLSFAHFAGTSPLFGSDASKLELWTQNTTNGIFLSTGYNLTIGLLIAGVVITITKRAYNNFTSIFTVALCQIAIFFAAWIKSSNVDPRYFLPALPYFIILVCWSLKAINIRIITVISVIVFFVQFIRVNEFAWGLGNLVPVYGEIRPLIKEPEKNMRIMHDIMPLVTRDSSIIFDLNPEFGVAEFQFELAKQNVSGNWSVSCHDISNFFNFIRQEIDTSKINTNTAWTNLLAYNADYYITWSSRLYPEQIEIEMKRIDKYNAVTVPARWAMAEKMKKCTLYEVVSFASYPEMLIYKRKDVPLNGLLKTLPK